MPGVSLTVKLQLDAGMRLLVRRLDRGDQVDAEADDAQRALVGRGGLVARARLGGEQRLGREGGEPRERGATSQQLTPIHPVVAHAFRSPSESGRTRTPPYRALQWATRRTSVVFPRARRSTGPIRDQDAFIDASHRACQQTPYRSIQPPLEYVRRFGATCPRGRRPGLRIAFSDDGRTRWLGPPIGHDRNSLACRTPLPSRRA